MTSRYYNDQWVLEDTLGVGRAGDQVATIALEVTPPFTLGVTGKWGSGKTSVMRRAFATLNGKPIAQAVPLGQDDRYDSGQEGWERWAYDFPNRDNLLTWSADLRDNARRSLCVWYSPWQHQSAENPLIPLLLEIKEQFAWRHKAMNVAGATARHVGLAGLALMERLVDVALSLKLNKPVKVATGTTEAVARAWSSANDGLTVLSDGQRFHLLFEDAVETLLAGIDPEVESNTQTIPDARLIIFIDDLDRCEESVIVTLLEAIKIYLGTKRCVFILGMDDGAVLGALKRHWKDRGCDGNREYLEKLVQCSLAVPLPRGNLVRAAVQSLLIAHKVPNPEPMAVHIVSLLEPNPRKIKNFVNAFCASWETLEFALSDPSDAEVVHFVVFQYLRQYHQSIWRILERQPWALKILVRVLAELSELDAVDLPVGAQSVRVMQQFMVREFAHVLKDDARLDETSHLNMPMEKVVDGFLERLDRKRSDDYLVKLVKEFFDKDSELEDRYLYLPERLAK